MRRAWTFRFKPAAPAPLPRIAEASAAFSRTFPRPDIRRMASFPTPPRKDTVHTNPSRAPREPHAITEAAQAARIPPVRREPEPTGLTPDEIRRIILDLMG